jgi:hypothetical protein
MQYLALIYGDESRWGSLSPEEREREMGEYMALSSADVTKGGNELDSIDEACTWAAKIPAAKHGAIEVRPVYVDGGDQS